MKKTFKRALSMFLCTMLMTATGMSFVLPVNAAEELVMDDIFADGMILQREKPVNIFGKSSNGDEIEVNIKGGSVDNTAKANVIDNKDWTVTLPAMEHEGATYTLTITSKKHNDLIFTDVLVGEVWIAAGQSNMNWCIGTTGHNLDGETITMMENYNYPNVKIFMQLYSEGSNRMEYRRWEQCGPLNDAGQNSAPKWSVVALYFAKELSEKFGNDIPIGIIQSATGNLPCQSFVTSEHMNMDPKPPKYDINSGTWEAGWAYNTYLKSIETYGVKGGIWYQGEADIAKGYSDRYDEILTRLIECWRDNFKQPDMAFIPVQLPSSYTYEYAENWNNYFRIREGIAKVAEEMDNVAMAVVIDYLEGGDIHPLFKRPVGERLALAAWGEVYGNDVEYKSPSYKNHTVNGETVIVEFNDVNSGLEIGGMFKNYPIHCFWLAGDDADFFEAEANIVDGNKIELWSADVPNPVDVRYAYMQAPQTNLYAKNGLPVAPFRTDSYGYEIEGYYGIDREHPDYDEDEAARYSEIETRYKEKYTILPWPMPDKNEDEYQVLVRAHNDVTVRDGKNWYDTQMELDPNDTTIMDPNDPEKPNHNHIKKPYLLSITATDTPFLEFNVPQLPEDAVITSAIFRMREYDSPGIWGDEGTASFDIKKVNGEWQYKTITKDNMPAISSDVIYGTHLQKGTLHNDWAIDVNLNRLDLVNGHIGSGESFKFALTYRSNNAYKSAQSIFYTSWYNMDTVPYYMKIDKSPHLIITYKMPKIRNLEVTKAPDKTDYKAGDRFIKTGMEITAEYENGHKEVIDEYQINTRYISAGDTGVTITRSGVNVVVPITVETPRTPVEIKITTNPNEMIYTTGDYFDKTGMVVTVYYDDGEEEIITNYTASPQMFTVAGQIDVTVSYLGVTSTVIVTVNGESLRKKGFVTNNGNNADIAISDAIEIFRHLAGKKILTGDDEFAADIDGKGGVTIQDAIYIFRYLASKITMSELQELQNN